jgi:hypothetical protein
MSTTVTENKIFMQTGDAPASAESIPEEEELTLVRCSK